MITKKIEIFRSFLYFFSVFLACSAGAVIIYDKSMDVINDNYANSVYAYDVMSKEVMNVDYPNYGEIVYSPLDFYGTVKGDWFSEGKFPVKVLDKSGDIVGISVAEAETDFVTNQMINFRGTVTFSTDDETGFIVFEKANPSKIGETNNFKIPIKFK